MSLILYHRVGGRSAPRLAAFMGIGAVRNVTEPVDNLIRWGQGTEVPTPGKEINPRSSLIRYSTRQKQLELLREADVTVPAFSVIADVGWPMLGRNEGKGKRQTTRGRGITYYPEAPFPIPKHPLYMRYYPKQRQFRVHVIGKSTRTRELIPNHDPGEDIHGLDGRVVGQAGDPKAQPIWNYHTGFTYRNLTLPRPTGVISQAKKAVKALKLDFGAVDVIVCNGQPIVLEVNTAPGLHELTLSWYARHLAPLIGLDPTTLPGLREVTV